MKTRRGLLDRNDPGFTLLEMLVVLVLIALIAALAVPQVMKLLGGAKSKAARIQLETLSQSLHFYQLDVGSYPTTEQGLSALLAAPAGVEGWNGPYVRRQQQLADSWGRAVLYVSPAPAGGTSATGAPNAAGATGASSPNGAFELKTLGADGKTGGEGDDADISISD